MREIEPGEVINPEEPLSYETILRHQLALYHLADDHTTTMAEISARFHGRENQFLPGKTGESQTYPGQLLTAAEDTADRLDRLFLMRRPTFERAVEVSGSSEQLQRLQADARMYGANAKLVSWRLERMGNNPAVRFLFDMNVWDELKFTADNDVLDPAVTHLLSLASDDKVRAAMCSGLDEFAIRQAIAQAHRTGVDSPEFIAKRDRASNKSVALAISRSAQYDRSALSWQGWWHMEGVMRSVRQPRLVGRVERPVAEPMSMESLNNIIGNVVLALGSAYKPDRVQALAYAITTIQKRRQEGIPIEGRLLTGEEVRYKAEQEIGYAIKGLRIDNQTYTRLDPWEAVKILPYLSDKVVPRPLRGLVVDKLVVEAIKVLTSTSSNGELPF